mgnify:CR=1 FL=1
MNIVKGVKKNLKTYIKTIILIFSMVVSCLFVASLITYECATTVNAQTVSTGQTEINIDVKNAPVATSGDAGYMSTVRTVTDVYNVCAYTVRACILGILECHKNSVQSVYRF